MAGTAIEEVVNTIHPIRPQSPKKSSKFSGLMAGDNSILEPEQTKWPSVLFPQTANSDHRHVRIAMLPDDVCPINPPPARHNQRELQYVPSMLSTEQVATIRANLDRMMQPSSTDTTNTFQARDTRCVVLVEDGEVPINDNDDVLLDSLVNTLLPLLHDTIVPTAQALLGRRLVLADALIRSYDPSEHSPRNTLAPHYDQTSYASVIVPLNDPRREIIQGGLYVQSGASITTRRTIEFENVGDGVLHTYDVMHGVHVNEGNRLSLVVWLVLEEDQKATTTTTTIPSWIEREACTSVHAAFLRGVHAQEKEEYLEIAQSNFEWAAQRGHALSQYCLSNLLIEKGQKLTHPNPRAADLLCQAAGMMGRDEDGLVSAQYDLGISFKNGYLGLERNPEAAKVQFRRAAQQGCRLSQAILNDPSRWI